MYTSFVNNDPTLPESWKKYFHELGDEADVVINEINGPSWNPYSKKVSINVIQNQIDKDLTSNEYDLIKSNANSIKAVAMIRSYRQRGHLIAKLDPLGLLKAEYLDELHPESYGFNKEDYKNNLWVEFYIIKSSFSPISTFISQTEKRNQYSLINQCKTFSYNQSIQVLIEADKKLFDDCLILNTADELCCGSTFNILLKRDNVWMTPRKESGCLQGIMVKKAIELNIDIILEKDLLLILLISSSMLFPLVG